MVKGIYVAARGLNERMQNLEIVANNLANINTTGFKREVPFSEILTKAGKPVIQHVTDYSQGSLVQTSNPLDLAISGKGFFVVQTKYGDQLTRNGNFQISDDGYIVDQQGNRLLGKNGPINVMAYSTDKNQKVTVTGDGILKIGDNVVDNLLIANPWAPGEAVRGSGVDFTTGSAGFQVADGNNFQIKQGYLEESNVNPVKELEEMIQLNTEYGSAQKVVNSLDQSLDEANQVGKV